jgi:hypothetical protein
MFYEHDQVEDLLSCSCCTKRYELVSNRPLLLPCYKTLCENCIRSRTFVSPDSVYKVNCFHCLDNHDIQESLDSESHQLPLPLNDSLIQLLRLKPVDVHKAELMRKLADLVKKIKTSLDELDQIELNTEQSFLTYFDLIKSEICKSAQYLIEQTVQYRDKLLLDLGYIRDLSVSYFNEMFSRESSIGRLKSVCQSKKAVWQSASQLTEQKTLGNYSI